ncbi:MAG: hypothetical protein RBT36_02300 [Desulfobulbus sp.]|jgi:hypothetical protein|nr:hypothetical protein [Desulfobulbus sp.]
MDPALLIPVPDAIPVPWGWFQALLLLTFFCHILLMNMMLGTAWIALASHFSKGGGTVVSEDLGGKLPFIIAFTVNLGVAPLLFAQLLYGQFVYTSSILMAAFWLAVIPLLTCAYALAYLYKYRFERLGRARLVVIGLVTLLLLAIGFIYTNNFTLMQQPQNWARYFDRPDGFLLNLNDPTLWPRYLHFMLSAPAIGGLALALYHRWRASRGAKDAEAQIRRGCRWFTHATLLNVLVGLWFVAVLPKGVLTLSTTTGLWLTVILVGGIVLTIPALVYGFACRPLPATVCTLTVLALMVGARSLLRTAMLAPWFSPADLPVQPAWSPLVIFLVFFVAGLALIAWMLRFTARATSSGEAQS